MKIAIAEERNFDAWRLRLQKKEIFDAWKLQMKNISARNLRLQMKRNFDAWKLRMKKYISARNIVFVFFCSAKLGKPENEKSELNGTRDTQTDTDERVAAFNL